MRLICPNCGAQYEVDDSMLPADGRDVQCSNCSTTWFQEGTRSAEMRPAAKPARRNAPDDETLDVLRQEREYEARAREAGGLESQADLGLQEPEDRSRARAARERMSRLSDHDDAPAPQAEAPQPQHDDADDHAPATIIAPPPSPERPQTGSRRDLLPDIEEINSTLRPDDDHFGASDPDLDDDVLTEEQIAKTAARKRGFRLGLSLMVMIAAALVALYFFAPALGQMVPALKAPLMGYVSTVDGLRIALDQWAGGIVDWLSGQAAGTGF